MTNGHDLPPDYIIGRCPYCKKSIENIDRFYEEKLNNYVHLWCSKDPSSERIKKDWKRMFPERIKNVSNM